MRCGRKSTDFRLLPSFPSRRQSACWRWRVLACSLTGVASESNLLEKSTSRRRALRRRLSFWQLPPIQSHSHGAAPNQQSNRPRRRQRWLHGRHRAEGEAATARRALHLGPAESQPLLLYLQSAATASRLARIATPHRLLLLG